MANVYKAIALAAARVANASPQTVRNATYAQVASFSGVTLDENGKSPDDFSWKTIRRYVAKQRWFDQRDDMVAAVASQVQTAIRARTGFADATVTVDDEHRLVISRAAFDPE